MVVAADARLGTGMAVIHGTKKLLSRIPTSPSANARAAGPLGSWYATPLFWKPQVALLVDEDIYLPVLMHLAPAATLLQRFADALERILDAHGAPAPFIETVTATAHEPVLARTSNRRALGVMNELAQLATHHHANGDIDLVTLAVDLARTPIGPLFTTHVSPDRALAVLHTRNPTRSEVP